MDYVKDNGLAGVLINSIDMDDFHGSFCNEGPYPFLRATLGLLMNDPISNPVKLTTSALETKLITPPDSKKSKNLKSKKAEMSSVTKSILTSFSMKTTVNAAPIVLVTPPNKNSKKDKNLPERKETRVIEQFNIMQKFEDNNKTPKILPIQKPVWEQPPLPDQTLWKQPQQQQQQQQHWQPQQWEQAPQAQAQPQQQLPNLPQWELDQQQKNLKQHAQALEVIQKIQSGQQITANQPEPLNYENRQWMQHMQQHQQQVENQLKLQQGWQNQNQIYQAPPVPQYQAPAPQYQPPPPPPPPPQYIPPPPPAPPQAQPQIYQPAQTYDNNKCQNKQSGIYREEMDCSAFYICEAIDSQTNARLHKFTCPQGLLFSMDECTCSWPSDQGPCVPLTNSFCRQTGPPPGSQQNQEVGYEPLPSPSYPTSFSCYGKEKGLHRDAQDCNKFYYCQIYTASNTNDLVVIKHDFSCPAGLHFNVYRCQCDWPAENSCQLTGNTNTLCLSNF